MNIQRNKNGLRLCLYFITFPYFMRESNRTDILQNNPSFEFQIDACLLACSCHSNLCYPGNDGIAILTYGRVVFSFLKILMQIVTLSSSHLISSSVVQY